MIRRANPSLQKKTPTIARSGIATLDGWRLLLDYDGGPSYRIWYLSPPQYRPIQLFSDDTADEIQNPEIIRDRLRSQQGYMITDRELEELTRDGGTIQTLEKAIHAWKREREA